MAKDYQNFQAGQSLFKGLSFIGQYVGFNVQKQKIVIYDGVLGEYREFDRKSVNSSLTA